MAARHVARDRQAEPDAAGRLIARRVEPDERPEHPFAFRLGNAGPVIVDQDIDPVIGRRRRQPDMLSVAARIGDQIAEAAPQRVRPDRQYQFGAGHDGQRRAVAPRRRRQILDQQPDIGLDRGFGSLAAGEIEVGIDQPLHLGDIGFQFGRRPHRRRSAPAPASCGSAACADRATRRRASRCAGGSDARCGRASA